MTTQQLINYYANLLIIQYIGKTNAYATVQALVTPVIMDKLLLAVQDAFNLDTAVGTQLDVIGKYVGATRTGFNLNGAPINLSDADFLILIKMTIINNSSGSSLNMIQTLIAQFFAGQVYVYDHQSMRLSYLINTSVVSTNLLQLFLTKHLLPKPMGVQLSAPIFTSSLTFFGMVSARAVAAYASQNSVSITAAANTIASISNIQSFNSAAAPITGTWLSAQLGVAI